MMTRALTIIAFAVLCTLSSTVRADSISLLVTAVEHQWKNCELIQFATVYHGQLEGDSRPMRVVTFTIEGCGGGNNAASTFGIFAWDGAQFVELRQPASGLATVVTRVSVTDRRRVVVAGLDHSVDDPRCCPSINMRATLTTRGGQLVILR